MDEGSGDAGTAAASDFTNARRLRLSVFFPPGVCMAAKVLDICVLIFNSQLAQHNSRYCPLRIALTAAATSVW